VTAIGSIGAVAEDVRVIDAGASLLAIRPGEQRPEPARPCAPSGVQPTSAAIVALGELDEARAGFHEALIA